MTQPRYEVATSLRVKIVQCSDQYWVSEADPSIMTQSWLWVKQIAVKKYLAVKYQV